MNNENEGAPALNLSYIFEYFSLVPRQGPGSEATTLQALSCLTDLPSDVRMADVGCGTGAQTLTLARHVPGTLHAIDLCPLFIDTLRKRLRALGLSARVTAEVGDMNALPFDEGSLDAIWCEGAIYNMGFREGLRAWRRFLKPGAYVALTDAAWFTNERPEEVERFWQVCPDMATVPDKLEQLSAEGYDLVSAFRLPDTCWTDHFYRPQCDAQVRFLRRHPGCAEAEALVERMRQEADMFARNSRYYGYVFFIARRRM